MIVQVYAYHDAFSPRHPGTGMPSWWCEVEIEGRRATYDPAPRIIHADGMYATEDEAARAGEAWAKRQGHTIGPFPESRS